MHQNHKTAVAIIIYMIKQACMSQVLRKGSFYYVELHNKYLQPVSVETTQSITRSKCRNKDQTKI